MQVVTRERPSLRALPARAARPFATVLAVLASAALGAPGVSSQAAPVSGASPQAAPPTPSGLEVGAVPALNFDSDEGFGYGAVAELYHYGEGVRAPYVWTLQPTVFLTTGGRRDFTVFFDAPHVLPSGWRLDAFLGREKQIATPYYGVGNAAPYDEALGADDGPNPYFYRFGRTRTSATANVQRALGRTRLRALLGAGLVRTAVDPVPEDEGMTLYGLEVARDGRTEWSSYVRAGLVWDSRDRETGPRRGTWTELLVQRVDDALGADRSYTRWTFTDRRYVPLGGGLVFAHRYLLQQVGSGAALQDLYLVQSSFKQQEGLGGAKTVRGVLKNRFVGRGMVVWNAELRWRALDFELVGRRFHAVLSAFLDQGRVWSGEIRVDEVLDDLHRGFGGGMRVGMGENFVVALDVGTSEETGLPMYLGLGYLF